MDVFASSGGIGGSDGALALFSVCLLLVIASDPLQVNDGNLNGFISSVIRGL